MEYKVAGSEKAVFRRKKKMSNTNNKKNNIQKESNQRSNTIRIASSKLIRVKKRSSGQSRSALGGARLQLLGYGLDLLSRACTLSVNLSVGFAS